MHGLGVRRGNIEDDVFAGVEEVGRRKGLVQEAEGGGIRVLDEVADGGGDGLGGRPVDGVDGEVDLGALANGGDVDGLEVNGEGVADELPDGAVEDGHGGLGAVGMLDVNVGDLKVGLDREAGRGDLDVGAVAGGLVEAREAFAGKLLGLVTSLASSAVQARVGIAAVKHGLTEIATPAGIANAGGGVDVVNTPAIGAGGAGAEGNAVLANSAIEARPADAQEVVDSVEAASSILAGIGGTGVHEDIAVAANAAWLASLTIKPGKPSGTTASKQGIGASRANSAVAAGEGGAGSAGGGAGEVVVDGGPGAVVSQGAEVVSLGQDQNLEVQAFQPSWDGSGQLVSVQSTVRGKGVSLLFGFLFLLVDFLEAYRLWREARLANWVGMGPYKELVERSLK